MKPEEVQELADYISIAQSLSGHFRPDYKVF